MLHVHPHLGVLECKASSYSAGKVSTLAYINLLKLLSLHSCATSRSRFCVVGLGKHSTRDIRRRQNTTHRFIICIRTLPFHLLSWFLLLVSPLLFFLFLLPSKPASITSILILSPSSLFPLQFIFFAHLGARILIFFSSLVGISLLSSSR